MAQTTSMEGLESGNVACLKRPWPFELESFEQAEYNFNPQPVAEYFQGPWDINPIWDEIALNTGNNYAGLDHLNERNAFGQAQFGHVTTTAAPLQPILNQEYIETQFPLEECRVICFGSVFLVY